MDDVLSLQPEITVCCAGPSLNKFDWRSRSPVAAVSTAIRVINTPDIWIVNDPDMSPEVHGEWGLMALRNPHVLVVTKECNRLAWQGYNAQTVQYVDIPARDRKTSLHLAITWALAHYRRILLVGADHAPGYAHDRPLDDARRAHQSRLFRRCEEWLDGQDKANPHRIVRV